MHDDDTAPGERAGGREKAEPLEILEGAVDDLPEGAFAYAGTLDDVRRHAREGVERCYGK